MIMENTLTLYSLTDQMTAIEDMLVENGGELTPELEELWQETEESLTHKVDNYNDLIKFNEDYAENIGNRIKELQALKKTHDNSVKRLKEHIKDTMTRFGIKELKGQYCKITLSHSTSTEVDEGLIIQPYLCRLARLDLPAWITAELKVNKTILKDNFKDKDVTPAGVSFVKNTSLRIK